MVLLVACFFILLVLGVPVAFVLGTSSWLFLLTTGTPTAVVPERMFSGLNSYLLIAIPGFILAGHVMTEGGITERLVRFALVLVGRLPGSLAHVTIVSEMFMSGISGSAAADSGAVGSIMIPAMKREGYDHGRAAAVAAAAGGLGPLIPPSIAMVIFGIASGASIGALFLGGALPGILLGLVQMVFAFFIFRRYPPHPFAPAGTADASALGAKQAFWPAFVGALPGLGAPFIVVGGMVGGVFTPTESAAVAVLYAVLVGVLVYRRLSLRSLPRLLLATARTTAVVMWVVGMATVLSWVITTQGLPRALASAIRENIAGPGTFLALCIVVYLLVGMFIDEGPAILILTPVLMPIVVSFGIDPVHFGVVTVFALTIGLITPPVGISLFIVSSITGLSLEQLSKRMVPYIVADILVLIVVAYVPALTLTLPRLLLN